MAKPVSVAKVQTDDRNVNQLQDNIIQAIKQLQTNINGASAIGEVRSAFLTEAQWQQQAGPNWVLADGRSAKGTAYETITGSATIPNAYGTTLRMTDGGSGRNPAGNLALGTYQADATAKNGLALTDPGHSHTETVATALGGGSTQVLGTASGNGGSTTANNATSTDVTGITLGAGDAETRGKCMTVNFFVRIN